MEHCGVVSVSDAAPDFREAVVGELPRQEHGDLAGGRYVRSAVAGVCPGPGVAA